MGVLGFICFQFMIRNTEIRVETEVTLTEEKPKFNVFKALANFMKNRPAVGATLAAMGMFIGMQGASTAVSVVFQRYYQNAQISGIVQLFAMIPIAFFTPLARKMVTKYGKKELSVLGAICSIIGGLGLFIITPDNKTLDLVIYVVCQLVYSLGLGIYSTVSWAMMGDAIDYNEWKTGNREEGVVYSLHSFFRKLAQGVGPALALVVMNVLGYVNNAKYVLDAAGNKIMDAENNPLVEAAVGDAATIIHVPFITDETALKLRILVAVLFLVAALFQFIGLALVYNLDKKTMEKMNAELAVRRGEQSGSVGEEAASNLEAQLVLLKERFEGGAITEEEYNNERENIISKL